MDEVVDEYEGLRGLDKYTRMVWKPFFDDEFCDIIGKDVLDVGCGDGRYTYILKLNSNYKGIDIKKTEFTTEIGRAECLPYAGESFDEVISIGVLDYVDVDKSLDEMVRVLRPGGTLRLLVPNKRNPYHYVSSLFGKNKDIKRRFTTKEMIDLVLDRGLFVEDILSMGFCAWVPTKFLQEMFIPVFDDVDYITTGYFGNNIYVVAKKIEDDEDKNSEY